jgi:hypothetical protein
MTNNQTAQIKVGDTVQATFAWTESEQPTDKNFYTGKVTRIISKGYGIVYFELEKLERQIPADRVSPAA